VRPRGDCSAPGYLFYYLQYGPEKRDKMIDIEAIRGVVFDMDGVLIDSAPLHDAAFREVFSKAGIDGFEYPRYAGWRTPEVVADMFRRAGREPRPGEIEALALEKSRLAREKVAAADVVAPDCVAALEALSKRYRLGLASSGSRASVDAFPHRRYFGSVLSGEDVSRAKPDPEIYRKACAELGIAPSECVVVEDAVSGVIAGKAAGARVIGMAGTSPEGALLEAGAGRVVHSLTELAAMLNPWTAIVPAAGRGSRLGFDLPKILYPVAGRPILDWLLDFLAPHFGSIVFVLSPAGVDAVRRELEARIPGRYSIAIQETPTGMGDAVRIGLSQVTTPHVAVVWGDQAALKSSSVEACLALHEGTDRPEITCPTLIRPNPYIHFERGGDGRITALLQAREGDRMPETGESDTGFFCFRAGALRELLARVGREGSESLLLPVIPLASRLGMTVLTPKLVTLEETIGVNSKEDAAALEAYLAS
jgi:bifunctional UDP-N-acetylglucosamine pyrophosphorylase/glucosamine-1-phosphate N-acetyltransferase